MDAQGTSRKSILLRENTVGLKQAGTDSGLVVYNLESQTAERASYNGSIEASQASDVGSIPIARSINLDDSIALTRLSY